MRRDEWPVIRLVKPALLTDDPHLAAECFMPRMVDDRGWCRACAT